jgi:hypothetical protein
MKEPVKIKAMILPPSEGEYGVFIQRLQDGICRAGRIPGGPMCPTRIKDNKMEEKNGGGYTKDTIENIEQVMEAHYGVDMKDVLFDDVQIVVLWKKERDLRIGINRVLSNVSQFETYKEKASKAELLSRKYRKEANECWMKALAIQDRLKKTVCVDVQYMDEVSGWIVSINQRIVSIVHLMKASYSGVVMNVVEKLIESFVHPDVFNDWVFKFHANNETPGGQSVVR